MELLRVLCDFNLDVLDEDWVRLVWNTDFVDYEEPPHAYLKFLESDDAKLLLRTSCQNLRKWIAANYEQSHDTFTENFSWNELMMLDINVQGLLAVLDYIMKTGQCQGANKESRQACSEATSLYLMFLTIPGSNAFCVYHPNLYKRVMDTLGMSIAVFPSSTDTNCNDDDRSDCRFFEKFEILEEVRDIIFDLITMLQSFRLKRHVQSLKITINILLNIMRLKCHNNDRRLDYIVSSLSTVAFTALKKLCSNKHGQVTSIIMLIAQYTLPYLLNNDSNNQQPKLIAAVQESDIYFLKELLRNNTKGATMAVVTLMHQLMAQCPERMEKRQKQAVVVIKLLNICNKDVIPQILKDVISFSFNGKISYRLFGQEIIGKLLTEPTLSRDILCQDTGMQIRKILIAVVLSRCTDRSPTVRARAMATFASFSDCNNEADKSILEGILRAANASKQFLTLNDLREALIVNRDPLPGSDTLIAMLLNRVNDERALVRRNGLKILRNLSVIFPSLTERTMHVISERCRDSTLTVRQFAVNVFSEILEQFPHNSKLLHEWVQAVMPQIYDIENKVQEKVLECLQSILLKKITYASTYELNDANSLPWRLLSKLSNMRMRKHLSKACSLWVKNGVITKSVIVNLQSHLGTNNTIAAWILLAALAEHIAIPSIEVYIADYKDVICKNDFHASLMLQVIRHAYISLDRDRLEELYQYLHKRIIHFEIKFNLISICLDIVNNILRHPHIDKRTCVETLMAKLIKLSETELQDTCKDDEGDTQDTLKMRAIFTLGHASLLCTDKISSSSLRILQKLLLDPESLPQAMRKTKNLQTSAVVLLCQQALRDRDIAKKVTPIFGELIRQKTDSPEGIAVKVNAAKALADICVRFTALVEPYLSDMCISTKDPNPTVRETILVIFIQLLLEDFIKMKGPFFFHILTMLSDSDNMIRELTIFLIEERLLKKNKRLISQQFLKSIYYYNNYHIKDVFYGYRMHDKERELLTLPGKTNQAKRNVIYKFMLDRLDSSAKFQLIVKLTKYILCEICNGKSIDVQKEEGACILQDTLYIINNINLTTVSDRCTEDLELDENPSQPNTSTDNPVTVMPVILADLKKHHLNSLLPMLCKLKGKLNTLSSLKSDVERTLYKVSSKYNKEQLFNLLNEYPELEKDMDYYGSNDRRQRQITSEVSDDADVRSSPMTPTENHDSLLDACTEGNRTPARVFHSPTPSWAPEPSTSWAPEPSTSRASEPLISWGPEPSTSWAPEPSTSWAPESSTSMASEPSISLELSTSRAPKSSTSPAPKSSTSRAPKSSTSWASEPSTSPELSTSRASKSSTSRAPEPSTSWASEPSTSWASEPSTSRATKPSTSWQTEPSASWEPDPSTLWELEFPSLWEPEPSTSGEPQPSTSWAPEPSTSWEPEPSTSWEPEPSTSWAPDNTNDRLSNDPRIPSPYKLIKNASIHLERLSLTALSSGSTFSTSTPKRTRDSNSGTSHSFICGLVIFAERERLSARSCTCELPVPSVYLCSYVTKYCFANPLRSKYFGL